MIGKIEYFMIGLLLFSFIPVWRGTVRHPRTNGANVWQLITAVRDAGKDLPDDSPFAHPHLKYEDAVSMARNAYNSGRTNA